MGVYWIHPDVCPSVRPSAWPSVDKVSGTFWKKKLLAQFISYLAFTLLGWVSWPLYIFVFLASFSALWWPNIWSKMGFPELVLVQHYIILDRVIMALYRIILCFYYRFCRLVADVWHFPNFLHKLLRYLKYHATLVSKMMPKFFWTNVFLKNSHLCSTWL